MNRLLLIAIVSAATILTAAGTPGRRIYVSGSGNQPITASVGGSGELPATMLPCANCHGADGRGIAEGGVVPSNITWLELTKPYRAATPNGRRRPAYNEQTLRRAIVEGVDSAGNPLHAAMPRYAMAPEDLNDLVAYLKVLGLEDVAGVTATSVRVGTIVPDGPIGEQMAAVLNASFKDAGEIHGRRVTLDVVTPAKLDAALESNPPFAFAGGLITGVDKQVEEAVERAAVPLVLPVTTRSDTSAGNRQRFYLSPGIEEQLHALLRVVWASGLPSNGPVTTGRLEAHTTRSVPSRLTVITSDDAMAALARRAVARLEQLPEVTVATRATAAADDAVLFLDPAAKLGDVSVQGNAPLLFLGNLLPEDFFKAAGAYGNRIKVALTTTPGDLTAAGIAEYRAFAARHSISGTHAASQLAAYAAAKVLVQALKQSGRELTREALRASLESLYEFETGVTPPLTFGRSRRIAAPRVHVATIDPKSGTFVPAGTFHTSD